MPNEVQNAITCAGLLLIRVATLSIVPVALGERLLVDDLAAELLEAEGEALAHVLEVDQQLVGDDVGGSASRGCRRTRQSPRPRPVTRR